MPSNKKVIAIRTEDEMYNKIEKIAKEQDRKMANLCYYIIKKYIDEYEAKDTNP